MRLIVFILLVCIFCSALFAVDADSLKQVLNKTAENQQAELMIQLATALMKTSPAEALKFAQQAENLSIQFGQTLQTASARKLQGNYHYLNKNYPLALQAYQSALTAALKAGNNKLTADIYNNLGQTYTQTKDYSKALTYLLKSLTLRKTFPSRDDEISSLNNIGLVYWNKQDYNKSTQYYLAAAKLLDKTDNHKLTAVIYNNLGNGYSKKGDKVKALDAYIRSLRLKETFGTQADLAVANANIGNLYYLIKDLKNSIIYYERAKKLYEEIGDNTREAQITGNLGVVYNEMKAYDQALQLHQSALSEFRRKGSQADIAKSLNNIGNVYKELKNYDQALKYYEEAVTIKTNLKDLEGLAVTHINIGEIKYLQKDYEAALQHTLTSLDASKRLQSQTMLRNNYLQLATIYSAKQDYKNAYLAQKNYEKLDAELFREESQNVLAEMITRFETEEKSKEINQLKTEHQLQKRKLAKQIRDKIRLIILLLLILIITLIMGLLYRQKQREVKKRKAIQAELELLNKELENRVEQEMEKYNIQQQIIIQKSKLEGLGKLSAGIAHEINQPLSALSMSLDNIQMTVQSGKLQPDYLEKKTVNMQEDIQRIRQIIEHVRLFSRDQKDSHIEQIDVNETIHNSLSLLQTSMVRQDIDIELNLAKGPLFAVGNRFKLEQVLLNLISNARDAMETKQEMGLYSNERKTLSIRTNVKEDQIIIEVRDNGCGIAQEAISNVFEPFYTTKNPDRGTGLGLSISYGIISEMQGNIFIKSQENIYTTITIALPNLRSNNESA